jgi:hypothetical protein
MGEKSNVGGRLPVFCYACGHDLRRASIKDMDTETVGIVSALDTESQKSLSREWAQLSDGSQVYSQLYFRGLRQMLFLSVAGRRTKRFHDFLADRFGRPTGSQAPTQRPKNFESLRVRERFLAAYYTAQLLKEWPTRFLEVCRLSRTWSSCVFQDLDPVPYWLFKPAQENLYIVHTPWRGQWRKEGAHSYSKLGQRLLTDAPRTKTRHLKIAAWIAQHPDLHDDPILLAAGLRKAKLYSPSSHHSQILRACQKYLDASRHRLIPSRGVSRPERATAIRRRTPWRKRTEVHDKVLANLRSIEAK